MRALVHLKEAQERLNLAALAVGEVPKDDGNVVERLVAARQDLAILIKKHDGLLEAYKTLATKYEGLLAYCKGHSNRLENEIIKAELN